jgi:hypothetical protein
MADRMREKAKTFTPEQREQVQRTAEFEARINEGSSTISEEEMRMMALEPMQQLLAPMVNALTPLLFKMDVVVVETDSSPGFISSDHPCVWFDPEAYKRPPAFQSPGLMYPSTEISLPISPNQMLIFKREFEALRGYARVKETIVDQLNRRTRFSAHEFFIVNSNMKKEQWFDLGVEHKDS